ncbi:hypothetical protein EMIT0158MI4_150210 [Burkholderia ambifaria]
MHFHSVINQNRELSDANPDQKIHAGCYGSSLPLRLRRSGVRADRRQQRTGRLGLGCEGREA